MDETIIHLARLPRRFPGPPPVQHLAHIPHKSGRVRCQFPNHLNFSFILSGGGDYRWGDRHTPITAPCVITQWPGPHFDYGETDDQGWEEAYVIFDAEARAEFQQRHLWHPDRAWWPISDLAAVRRILNEILATRRGHHPSVPPTDLIDRLTEAMIVASLAALPVDSDPANPTAPGIESIREWVARHFPEPIDWPRLLATHGMSDATFRRRWLAQIGVPPARYVTHLRLQEAVRLLLNTTRPISEVARACGYEDSLYFSRTFRKHFDQSPRQYRAANQAFFGHAPK